MRYDEAVGLMILGAAILLWVHFSWFCRYLKKTHHSVWVTLGEPSVFNYSTRNSIQLYKFIWHGYRRVDDRGLLIFVFSGRILQLFVVALILSSIVAVSLRMA
jgi:hypothetical protein